MKPITDFSPLIQAATSVQDDANRQRLERERARLQPFEHIKVKSNLPPVGDAEQYVLFDRHAAHPSGELSIVDREVHTVAATPKVLAALKEGRLLVVDDRGIAHWRGSGPPKIPYGIKPAGYRLVRHPRTGLLCRSDELLEDEKAELARQELFEREAEE